MIITAVGNYPKIGPPARGPSLRAAIGKFDGGGITEEELRRVEEETTKDVLQQQIDAGLDLVTDGQIPWDDGQTHLAQRLPGFSLNGLIRYFDTNTYYRHPIVERKLEWPGPLTVTDYQFAVQHSSKPVKAILPGPFTLGHLSQPGYYQELRSLVLDLAHVLNQEARALQEAGAPLIQFDEPAIGKWKEEFSLLMEASEIVIQGLTTKTAIYTWFRDIAGLEPDLFHLPFQVFGLDFVWGPKNWEVLSRFPGDKELGLGIVDARNTRMESVEEIVEVIRRATSYVSLDHLYVNSSCGLDYLPRQNAYDKLVRLAEGVNRAREVLS